MAVAVINGGGCNGGGCGGGAAEPLDEPGIARNR